MTTAKYSRPIVSDPCSINMLAANFTLGFAVGKASSRNHEFLVCYCNLTLLTWFPSLCIHPVYVQSFLHEPSMGVPVNHFHCYNSIYGGVAEGCMKEKTDCIRFPEPSRWGWGDRSTLHRKYQHVLELWSGSRLLGAFKGKASDLMKISDRIAWDFAVCRVIFMANLSNGPYLSKQHG
jgi:hypothetical protein